MFGMFIRFCESTCDLWMHEASSESFCLLPKVNMVLFGAESSLPVSTFPWARMRFSGMLCSHSNEYTSVLAQISCDDVMWSHTISRQMIPWGTFLSNVQAITRVQFQLYQNAAGEEPSGICWCGNSGSLRRGRRMLARNLWQGSPQEPCSSLLLHL